MSSAPDLTSRILRHERAILAGGIALLVALGWWFLATGAGMAPAIGMAGMKPPLTALVLMWWVMMGAMMLPSATPAILLYARVRQQRQGQAHIAASWVFAIGYLLVWLLFSAVAAATQAMIAGPDMSLRNPALGGAFLIAAGIYQLSPLKSACLRQCRAPAQFLSRHWRAGTLGALRLGVLHGAYCVGCCWMLMVLLFVGGVMNMLWVVALAVLVVAEKLAPRGILFGRAAGVVLVAWGIWQIART